MRAKWRKAIWAILALQLLLWHILFLENNMWPDYFVNRVVNHFGLPYVLYLYWKKLAVLIWLISAVLVMALHYWSYIRFRKHCINRLGIVSETDIRESLETAVLETGLHGRKGERSFLYRSQEAREPFLIGFRDPVLILPDREYSAQVLHFIFLHECYHMRHRDMLYKLFMLFIQSLLWFQPLIYLIKAISYQDVEVACDEAVVEGKDMSARKEYGYALLECLKMERARGGAYSTYFYHGKQMMKARISAIMKEDKKWDFPAYCGIGILVLDVAFNLYRIGGGLYEGYRVRKGAERAEESYYEGYDLPDGFTQAAIDEMTKLESVSEEAYYYERNREDALPTDISENAYQVDTSEGVLQVSGADGVWQEVPVTLEELFERGDEMDGKLTSLQSGSYQVDENKIIFAYGGDSAVPFSVVFYDEESRSFKKSVVTYEFYGGRRIYVGFPENGQEGFLIFTGERVVWHEMSYLFHTEDGGKSWQYVGKVPDMLTEGHSLTMGAVFINNSVGFMTIRSSEKPDIWRTQDGGKTWEYQELTDVPKYYSIAYAPEVHGDILCLYVGMEEYSEYGGTKAKYESTDEGRTWEYKGLVIRK